MSSPSRDTLILSLKLASGDFSSELHMPVPTNKTEQKRAVDRWLDFMITGLRLSAERMDAVFSTDESAALADEGGKR